MKVFIYQYSNVINGKKYIGITKNLKKRYNEHLAVSKNIKHYNLKNKVFPIHRAISKYGIDNFIFSILETANSFKIANAREIFLIKKLNSNIKNNGYNVARGGRGAVVPVSNKQKLKIQAALRKRRDDGLIWNQTVFKKDVLKIKKLIVENKLTSKEIGKKFNCTVSTIRLIQRNKIFCDVLKNTPILINGKNDWKSAGMNLRKGTSGYQACFSKAQVIKIRFLYKSGNYTQTALAKMFHVTKLVICRLVNRKTYKDIK